MKREIIIRAWTETGLRASLTPEQGPALPECPVSPIFTELSERELEGVAGGSTRHEVSMAVICN